MQLQQFHEKRGPTHVPHSWTVDPSLARWVDSVRSRWRKGKLSLRHFRALTSIGFCFLPLETSWESHFSSLSSYARRYGHARPSFLEDRVLNQWLAAQRKCFVSGSLCVDKYQHLADLGVDFRPWRIIFAEGLVELRRYRERHGHLNVSPNTKLASWIAQVRSSGPKSISRAGLIELKYLGFSWTRSAIT
jgi:Helicase associated domain